MTESRAVQQMRQDIEDLLRNRKSLRSVLDLSLAEIVTELNEARSLIAEIANWDLATPEWKLRARKWLKEGE